MEEPMFKDLEKKLLSYPKRQDPAFRRFVESVQDEPDYESCYCNLVILELIADGIIEVSLDNSGEFLFSKPQLN